MTLTNMLGFVSTDNDALVACLGDPQRTVAAYHELLRRSQDALAAIRAGLRHPDAAVREACCRLLDHLVDTDSMDELIAMADDPDPRVRIAAFHALACDRCKDATCTPGPDRVLAPALRHLRSDPDPQVRMRAAELAGKFAHTDPRARAALQTSHTTDPSPAVRKKAGWYTPGGTIYNRTAMPAPLSATTPETTASASAKASGSSQCSWMSGVDPASWQAARHRS